jgi:hypothetical protein
MLQNPKKARRATIYLLLTFHLHSQDLNKMIGHGFQNLHNFVCFGVINQNLYFAVLLLQSNGAAMLYKLNEHENGVSI